MVDLQTEPRLPESISEGDPALSVRVIGAPPPPRRPGPRPWWESRQFVALLILLSAVPLLYPPVPPLVDLMGHIGRFRVQLDVGHSPWLAQYYGFRWAPIGNLGVDLLVMPLAPLVGLENAVKLIVLSIPPLTVFGFLWVAREVHNRLPATALFALPFAFAHPFLFGFVNFALSMALAFLAFGLWLRLGRLGRTRLRALLFVPISIILFFTHAFGWGTLGLLAFSAEAVRQHDRGIGWFRSAANAAAQAAVMSLPIAIMLVWRGESSEGITGDWFNWDAKFQYFMMSLRDRWYAFDNLSVILVLAVFVETLRNRRLGFSRNLAFSALVLLAGFILLPRIVFGSAYADMRLAPYMIAVGILAIRFREATYRPMAQWLAIGGLAFFLVRIAATTASLAMASTDQQRKLTALDHVPMGAAVVNLVGQPCGKSWPLLRDSHLGAMVIVRRQGFSNDQWDLAGTNNLEVRKRDGRPFVQDPSQMVRPDYCRRSWTVSHALRSVRKDKFDYLWLIDVPKFDPKLLDGMERVWAVPGSSLYRLRPGDGESPPATPRTASAGGR